MKIAVVYWSGTGNTEAMAGFVAEGARNAGAEAELFTASDFGPEKLAGFDAFAFGCAAMGDEVLEEDEFQPMWDSVKEQLKGKKIALFGSYGWGDGQWMRDWENEAKEIGLSLAGPGLIVNYEPDDTGAEECRALGESLVK